jgi:hypothetical protein
VTEKQIKSNEARLHFREVLDDAGKGVFTGIGRWKDPTTVRFVSDEWYQRAVACIAIPAGVRRRGATETLRHFREVLDDAKMGVFTSVGRWNSPPVAWVVSDEWFQLAKERLAGQERRQPAEGRAEG